MGAGGVKTIRYWLEHKEYRRKNRRDPSAPLVVVPQWLVRAQVVYMDGTTTRSVHKSYKTKGEAEKELALLRQHSRDGKAVAPSRKTLGEYLVLWADRQANANTREDYQSSIRNHIAPSIGHIELQSLRPAHVFAMMDGSTNQRTGTPVSDNTRRIIWAVLSSALSDALERQDIAINPLSGVKRPRVKVTRQPTYWRRIEDVQAFLAVADTHQYGPFWRLAVYTGMREGELVPLRWVNVDLETQLPGGMATVHVVEAITKSDRGRPFHNQFTKGGDGYRSVLIDKGTAEALRAHRPQNADSGALVFPSKNGTLLGLSNVYRAFQHLVEKAGVPKIRLHDLRTTHTTHAMADGGVSIKGMQSRMGWSTAQMVLHYAKLTSTQDAEDALKIFARLDSPLPVVDSPQDLHKMAARTRE